jgi:hypothetical protein
VRAAGIEPSVVTSGDGLGSIRAVLGDRDDYSAADVVTYLMSGAPLALTNIVSDPDDASPRQSRLL